MTTTAAGKKRPPRKIGPIQRAVLAGLREKGYWYPACGWIWSNRSETIAVLESLVRRGLATREPMEATGIITYRPVKEEL